MQGTVDRFSCKVHFLTGFVYVVDIQIFLQGTVDTLSCKVQFIDRFLFQSS